MKGFAGRAAAGAAVVHGSFARCRGYSVAVPVAARMYGFTISDPTVGVAGASVETLADRLGALLDASGELPNTLAELTELKHALVDLRAFHEEAVTAQPGDPPWREVRRLLWRESVLGEAMLALRARFDASGSGMLRMFTRILVPRGALDD